jgi:hypothetical protein
MSNLSPLFHQRYCLFQGKIVHGWGYARETMKPESTKFLIQRLTDTGNYEYKQCEGWKELKDVKKKVDTEIATVSRKINFLLSLRKQIKELENANNPTGSTVTTQEQTTTNVDSN